MTLRVRSRALHYYVGIVVLYLLLGIFMPLDPATREVYELDMTQARIIGFITVLPLFVVWFAAFYCYGRLQKYAHSIRTSREGGAFKKIADGVMVLSWGLVVQAFVALILNGVADNIPSFYAAALIIQNYVAMAIPVAAFTLISLGTRQLLRGKHLYASLPNSRALLVLFALLGTLYSYLILHLRHSVESNAFHLPMYLLLSTIVVPYLYAWFSGLIAAYDTSLHARSTPGVIYKRSLNLVAGGLVVLIVTSIMLQYFNSLFLAAMGSISINIMLLIDYLLLIGVALGYAIISIGVRGLQRMEDI